MDCGGVFFGPLFSTLGDQRTTLCTERRKQKLAEEEENVVINPPLNT